MPFLIVDAVRAGPAAVESKPRIICIVVDVPCAVPKWAPRPLICCFARTIRLLGGIR
jgi:hypothetical protein